MAKNEAPIFLNAWKPKATVELGPALNRLKLINQHTKKA